MARSKASDTSDSIKVVVHGVYGKMGREVLAALCREPGLDPVGGVDLRAAEDYLPLPNGSGLIPLAQDLGPIIARTRPHVVVDFTNAEGAMTVARNSLSRRVAIVIGSTGLSEANLKEVGELVGKHGVAAVVAPNFALGAVLLLKLAQEVAPYFDYAEVIEAHHETKIDSPSGTAIAIGRAMAKARGKPFARPRPEKEPVPGSRGADVEGISVHSMRMPGRMAFHQVVLGTAGQTLTLTHDTIGRECYMTGVMLAIREVVKSKGLIVGLDKLLGLQKTS
ncbi:MAG: 4-hydroxy-tetrahydrodipicolinate reductase [Chloroflexi bacterium]|nr:4-hydroxy-tetrahydrodipicolinate reductase [Chloroflexota bacterium]